MHSISIRTVYYINQSIKEIQIVERLTLLTFKNIKQDTVETYWAKLKETIYLTFRPYRYLLDSPKVDADVIRPFFSEDFSDTKLESSLRLLTEALRDHHQKEVVFLLFRK